MAVIVREAVLGDAGAVVKLIGEMAAEGEASSPITESYVNTYLASPAGKVLVAEQGEQVVGMLSYSIRQDLFHAGPVGHIEELVVHREARGQGIGAALLTEALSRLRAGGCVEVSLNVMPDNDSAIRLYRRHELTEETLGLERHFT
ncbi:MAG: GNAT family N-acetyltransferase [Candidatus Eisenbacteria bacterium]|jgi:ribosomal protein S18 acetylase RimI-like enzyme|nr:GNAT family N-acetyltransferase [Candidatus Eisenbacteria bacterium]